MNWSLNKDDQNRIFFEGCYADPRFVGVWKGTDHGKFFKGETNSWIVNRKSDGTFYINFQTIHEDESISYTEEAGFWGIKNNEYYEFREKKKKKDEYSFLFLSNDSIHFIINEPEQKEEPYNFVDYKMLLD